MWIKLLLTLSCLVLIIPVGASANECLDNPEHHIYTWEDTMDYQLECCDIRDEDIPKLIQIMSEQKYKIGQLVLDDNLLTDVGIKAFVDAALQNQLIDPRYVVPMSFSNDKLTNKSAIELAKLNSYVSLYLDRTAIDDVGVSALAKNPNITGLVLDHTKITDASMLEIAKMKQIEYVSLGYNNLGSIAAIALAANPSITMLYLYHNNIRDAGAVALASAHYDYLDVLDNQIGTVGLDALRNAAIAEYIKHLII